MGFDQAWFDELREVTEDQVNSTHLYSLEGLVPRVHELFERGYVTPTFQRTTNAFVRVMYATGYQFDVDFRAYPRHVVNFPKGKAFHQQWNIGLTAGDMPTKDHVRLGLGFRWNIRQPYGRDGLFEYLAFQQQVRDQVEAFDQVFASLGNYYEQWNEDHEEPEWCENVVGALSAIVAADIPSQNAWRFFGTCLWCHDPEAMAVISDHERLRDRLIEVCDLIQRAGFGA